MKQRIINGNSLEFYNSDNSKKGEIKISGSNIIINPIDSNGTVVFGEAGTINDIEVGASGIPVDFTFLGGGTFTSNGGTLILGESGDTIDLSNATIGTITASIFKGGSFIGDGSGLTNVSSTFTNITASGNISSSGGTVTAKQLTLDHASRVDIKFTNTGDEDHYIRKDGDFLRFRGHDDSTVLFELKNNSNGSNITSFPNGNHGIGTTSPGEKLEVVGNISASGDLTVKDITTSGTISSTGTITAANTFIADAVDATNNDPGSDNLRVSGYGLIGNRDQIYFTNRGNKIVFGVGATHNGANKLIIAASTSTFSTAIRAGADSTYDIGTSATRFKDVYADQFVGAFTGDATGLTGTPDITVGTITAREFKTEFVSASIMFESGSTQFGNTLDDIHKMTGSLKVTGSINAGPITITKGGAIAGNTLTYLESNNVLYLRGGSSGLVLANADGSDNYYITTADHRWEVGSGNAMRLNATGLGIGTTTPTEKLQVTGNISASGNLSIGNGGDGVSRLMVVDSDKQVTLEKGAGGYFTSFGFDSNQNYLTYYSNPGMLIGYGEVTGAAPSVNTLFLKADGKVGIGTTTPTEALQVTGDISASVDIHAQRNLMMGLKTNDPKLYLYNNQNLNKIYTSDSASVQNAQLTIQGANYTHAVNFKDSYSNQDNYATLSGGYVNDSKLILFNSSSQLTTLLSTATSSFNYLNVANKLGIGTTSPQHELHVEGVARVRGELMVGSSGATNTPLATLHIKDGGTDAKLRIEDSDNDNTYFDFLVDEGNGLYINEASDTRLAIKEGGNVGIGTTTPTEKLQVTGNISASGEVNINAAGALFSSKLTVNGDAYTTAGWKVGSGATYVGKLFNTSGILTLQADTNRDIQFGDAGTAAVMYIDNSTEKVGIGTSTPGEKLTVVGNISASGIITANQIHADTLINHSGDANTGLQFSSDTVVIQGNNVDVATFASNRIELNKRTIFSNHITASGNISASGHISASELNILGTVHAERLISNGSITAGNITAGNPIFTGNISASGNMSASGDIKALSFQAITSITSPLIISNTDITYTADADGNEIGQHIFKDRTTTLATIDESGADFTSHITASGNISASGIITAEGLAISDDANITDRLIVGGQTTLNGNTIIGNAATDTHTFTGNITASGEISASGEIYSNNIETFWTSFNCAGDSSFEEATYGPNTQGINYYHWNKNWTNSTNDGGDPTGDHVHRTEINSGWYVPYDITVVGFVGGLTDGGASSDAVCTVRLFNTVNSLRSSNYDSNTGTTKALICSSGNVTLNGNRWKHYNVSGLNVNLSEGQYVLPRINMAANIANLRGQFTIKYKRRK